MPKLHIYSKVWIPHQLAKKNEEKLMKIFSMYKENLKRFAKDKLAMLNDKLEEWYKQMEA